MWAVAVPESVLTVGVEAGVRSCAYTFVQRHMSSHNLAPRLSARGEHRMESMGSLIPRVRGVDLTASNLYMELMEAWG